MGLSAATLFGMSVSTSAQGQRDNGQQEDKASAKQDKKEPKPRRDHHLRDLKRCPFVHSDRERLSRSPTMTRRARPQDP